MEGSGAMNSIDNLRDYVLTAPSVWSTTRAILVGYIDNIERKVADMVPLPMDADGEPIRVGDWITGDWDAKAKVVAITSEDVYWWEPDGCHWCHAYEVRHHHAPTVEDVLREFASDIADVLGGDDFRLDDSDELFAEYAAKLRLAGGEDE